MKKALGQTVRDIKREVNKKVLKVPSIEQKVLDATSNEPWGPHGTLLADIAQATRNYHEYQMITSVLWKRINDTGKNWRHVYKALTVLEYLVAHGSERVIDEIREHAYQIQTLSDFQYIDSSGRDQGSNVRKKSQSLVVLVNDKERIQEVRQKAAANRDKFRNATAGSMYRPGSHSSGGYGDRHDDRYGSREEDRNGNGKEGEYGYKDDDKYGRYGDPYGRDGDRYGREYEERYGPGDDYRGRSRSVDDYQYGSRSRSADGDRDRAYEDDGQYSSRGSGAKADDQSQDGSVSGRPLDRKYSEQNLGAPPSYEESVSAARSPTQGERDGVTLAAAPKPSSPPASGSPTQAASTGAPPPAPMSPPAPTMNNTEADGFDEFDPRGSFPVAPASSSVAAPTTSGGAEMDLLGSLSESFTVDSLALVPTSVITTNEVDASTHTGSFPTYMATTSASSVPNQAFDDPFGDGPFKAIPSTDGVPGQQQHFSSMPALPTASHQGVELPQMVSQNAAVGTFPGATYSPSSAYNTQLPSSNTEYSQQELSTPDQNIDILADILPPTGPVPHVNPQTGYPATVNQPVPQNDFLPQTGQNVSQGTFLSQSGPTANLTGLAAQSAQLVVQQNFPSQFGQPDPQAGFPAHSGQPPSLTGYPNQAVQAPQSGFATQIGQTASVSGFASQVNPLSQASLQSLPSGQSVQPNAVPYGNYNLQSGSAAPMGWNMAPQVSIGPTSQHNAANFHPQSGSGLPVASQVAFSAAQVGPSVPMTSQPAVLSTGSFTPAPPPSKDKFETKSTVWADTLSRGLVNLNISGPKTNPLSDIGVDFDALNRKEKRMEKPAATPVTSTVHMGKAMGSGSGMGRAGASAIRPPSNPMMGANMAMGGPRPGVGMGGYGGMNQQMGAGMGMNMPSNMGMGMNMVMGGQMQQPMGFPPGSTMPGGYNPMMGAGNYGQNPYGGGYR